MNRMLLWLTKFAVGKKVIKLLDNGHNSLIGKRSEILGGLYALLYLLESLRLLPEGSKETVDKIMELLLGAVTVTLAEKIRSVRKTADSLQGK